MFHFLKQQLATLKIDTDTHATGYKKYFPKRHLPSPVARMKSHNNFNATTHTQHCPINSLDRPLAVKKALTQKTNKKRLA